ncbi:MAG: response regulator [Firmicutes bacterium]|nr:response regulator [Bacillota bacterium]
MRVYILANKGNDQIITCISQIKHVNEIKVFDDNIRFIEQLSKRPPDCCLIKLGESQIPGLTTAEKIKRLNSEIRIILIAEDGDYALEGFEIGVQGYLLYPLEVEKLEQHFKDVRQESR